MFECLVSPNSCRRLALGRRFDGGSFSNLGIRLSYRRLFNNVCRFGCGQFNFFAGRSLDQFRFDGSHFRFHCGGLFRSDFFWRHRGESLGFGLRALGGVSFNLRLALDINAPTGQFCSEPRVLSFFADGERQLCVVHHYACDLVAVRFFGERNPDRFGRAEGIGYELAGIRIPFDHVDLLAIQFVYDGLNANAALTDTRTHRIDAILHR